MQIALDADDLSIPGDANTIVGTSFGLKYTAFRSITRFLEQTEDIQYGMIHWPGGAFSEADDGRYGFEFSGLMNPELRGRPSLEDIFELARSEGLSVAITLPTAKYQNNPSALIKDARPFLEDLYSGEFGHVPDKLIIEIGNEFYGAFSGPNEVARAEDYAEVVNVYANLIHDVEAKYGAVADQIEYSVQLGKTEEASTKILNTLTPKGLLIADYLSHHRYPFEPRGADDRIEQIDDILDDFTREIENVGGDEPGLFVSEYNSASLTRKEAAQKFLAESDDPNLKLVDLDLEGRTNKEFEQFYQEQLGLRTYGIGQAENVLQIFSEYQGIGAEALTSYGWDSAFAGRNTFEAENGQTYTFAGGAIKDMMAEALYGTRVLDLYQSNKYGRGHEDDIAQFGFASADKYVFFLVAPENLSGPMAIDFDLQALGPVQAVWGESLTAETPENWKKLFDIPTSRGVNQANEAKTYAVAEREAAELDLSGSNLEFEFYEPGEVIRLTFARNDKGEDEIRSWSGDDPLVLEGAVSAPNFPQNNFEFPTIEFQEELAEPELGEQDYESEGFAIEGIFASLLIPALAALAGI